jgi:hypothetical protein
VGDAYTAGGEASNGFDLNVQQQQEEEADGLGEEEECDDLVQGGESDSLVEEEEEADVPGEDLYWLLLSFAFFYQHSCFTLSLDRIRPQLTSR